MKGFKAPITLSNRLFTKPHFPQFPGLLHKCVWYALTHEGLQANMRSIMWGVGCKGYPQQWWVRVLRRFWGAHALHGIISLRQMFLWRQQGVLHMQTNHEVSHTP